MSDLSIKDFENALAELRRIVEQMETGELGLEASLQAFERGIRLTRQCQGALTQAQARVQMLMSEDGQQTLTDFPPANADAADVESTDPESADSSAVNVSTDAPRAATATRVRATKIAADTPPK